MKSISKNKTYISKSELSKMLFDSWSIARSKPNKGIELAEKVLKIAENEEDSILKAHAQKCLGACYIGLSKYEKAIKLLLSAESHLELLGEKTGLIQVRSILSTGFFFLGDYHNDLKYCTKAYNTALEVGDIEAQAECLNMRGTLYFTLGKNDEAITVLQEGLEIANTIDNKMVKARILDGLGEAFNNIGKYDLALEMLYQCLEIAESYDDSQVVSYALYGLGTVQININDPILANKYLIKSLKIRQDIGFQEGVALCYNKLSQASIINEDFEEAKAYLIEADLSIKDLLLPDTTLNITKSRLKIAELESNFTDQINCLKKISDLKENINLDKSSIRTKSLEFQFEIEKSNHERDLLERKNLELKANQKELEQHFKSLETLSELGQEITSTLNLEDLLETIYSKINGLMKAEIFTIGVHNEDKNRLDFPITIEKEKRLKLASSDLSDSSKFASICFNEGQDIIINKPDDYKLYTNQKPTIITGEMPLSIIYLPLKVKENVIGVISVQSFSGNAYSSYHTNVLKTLASYVSIALENSMAYKKVTTIQAKLAERDKDITDSLNYAQRIQRAIMPPESHFASALIDYFVLYQPKDIVSGDFYWCHQQGSKFIFAVVDCTGHGVPGAFMSIVGYNSLNTAINEYGLTEPGQILDKLNELVSGTLHKNDAEIKVRDGMDLTLCTYDINTNKIQVASAMNPFYLRKNNELIKVRGDRYPIGSMFRSGFPGYQTFEYDLEKGDSLYLSSDGIFDQFGEDKDKNKAIKKFKHERYRELLDRIQDLPMQEQKIEILNTFNSWKGSQPQLDDVCMISLKV